MEYTFGILLGRIRRIICVFLVVPAMLYSHVNGQQSGVPYEKKRLIVLLDPHIDSSNETDDAMSLVRLMVYSNMFDIEGLIATVSHNYFYRHVEPIHDIIDAYQSVRDNLLVHESGFPDIASLKAVTALGPADYGVQYALSENPISQGAQIIINSIEKDDDRPIWVLVWGDGAVIAQALEYIRINEGQETVDEAVSKLRIIDSAGQDDSGAWLMDQEHYPGLFYIRIVDMFCAMDPMSEQQLWNYPWCGECAKGDVSVVTDEWVAQNIQSHGVLGAVYPDRRWLKEGDSPTLLYLLYNGLNDPEYPWYGSWGGRMTKKPQEGVRGINAPLDGPKEYLEATFDPYYMYAADEDTWEFGGNTYTNRWATLFRWWVDFQHDFAARMDWTIVSDYSDANHPPVVVLEGDATGNPFYLNVSGGDIIELSAVDSYDPDSDNLTYEWWIYPEAGTYIGNVTIKNDKTSAASIQIPPNVDNDQIHVILSVTDDGNPSLTRYRRVVLNTRRSDDLKPSAPSGLQAIDSTENSITITWDAASDNVGVTGYKVYNNDKISGATGNTEYTINSLDPGTQYKLAVTAFDTELNESPKSTAITAFTRAKDTIPPTVPSDLRVDRITSNSLEISWDHSQDNIGIDEYEVFLDGNPRYITPENFITISRLEPSTSYGISVRAYDFSGNRSDLSDEIEITTKEPDNEPPSTPSGLRETEVTESTVSLEWEPSSDNVGVREYRIYVNHVEWETSTRAYEMIAGMQAGIRYSIAVSAVDESYNESPRSTSIEITTKNSDITTRPTLPEVSIIQIQDKTINPVGISEMKSLGFTELRNFGLEISEPGRSDKKSWVISGLNSTQVMNNNRVTSGLKLLYNFAEGEGDMVRDLSGTDPIMDLHISREGLATEWLVGQGLRINENTIISHEGQADGLIQDLAATNEITLEAWIKQEEIEQSGPARIITLSTDNSERAATLAHEGNKAYYNYVSRLTTSKTDINGTPQLNTKQDFISSSLHHVVYTRNSLGNEKIYVNGMVLASGNREGVFSSWNEDYQFALANEITGERPWKGILYLVALYNKALSGEEVNENYESGLGQIRFTTELDTLESNVDYQLKPFISTDQGLVYGQKEDFIYQNVANTDSLLSIYPNPSSGRVFVTIKNRDENIREGYLRLADFSGQVHFNRVIDLSEGLLEKIFELQLPASLQNGFYSLILIAGPRSVAEKFILMR